MESVLERERFFYGVCFQSCVGRVRRGETGYLLQSTPKSVGFSLLPSRGFMLSENKVLL